MAEKTDKTKVVELMDGYVCVIDGYSYSLAKKKTLKNGKTGYDYIAYFGRLQAVLKELARVLAIESLKPSQSLDEAVRAIRDSNERVAGKIDELLSKMGGRYGL